MGGRRATALVSGPGSSFLPFPQEINSGSLHNLIYFFFPFTHLKDLVKQSLD